MISTIRMTANAINRGKIPTPANLATREARVECPAIPSSRLDRNAINVIIAAILMETLSPRDAITVTVVTVVTVVIMRNHFWHLWKG